MTNKMFPFVTCTRNPIGGGDLKCAFECSYCWAQDMKNRFKWKKYQGVFRIIHKEIKRLNKLKIDDLPFLCDMIDIGDPRIPKHVLIYLFTLIGTLKCESVLLLTKNPYVYIQFKRYISSNVILGATIETDLDITAQYSKAPSTEYRLICMEKLKDLLPNNKRFISIEPILDFSPTFIKDIANIEPWAVAVGYDNYFNDLDEPTLDITISLINQLEKFTCIYRKTIRKRWKLY